MKVNQLSLDFPVQTPSFDDLVVGEANQSVIISLKNWQTWPDHVYALVGSSGSGRSTLAACWAHAANAEYLSAHIFQDYDLSMIDRLSTGPVAIDDADQLNCEESLLSLLNLARMRGRAVLLTTKLLPHDWDIASPDLHSRLSAIPIGYLDNPSEDMLKDMLIASCRTRYILLLPEIADYLAKHMEHSYAAIIQISNDLEKHANAGRRPTIPLVREILQAINDI